MSGCDIRITLSNNQYLSLSNIFPYFKKNPEKHALNAMYCGQICKELKWNIQPYDAYSMTLEELNNTIVSDLRNSKYGHAFSLGEYFFMPMVYKEYVQELKEKVFLFDEKYLKEAKTRIKNAKESFGSKPDAIIGIHGRFTDFASKY